MCKTLIKIHHSFLFLVFSNVSPCNGSTADSLRNNLTFGVSFRGNQLCTQSPTQAFVKISRGGFRDPVVLIIHVSVTIIQRQANIVHRAGFTRAKIFSYDTEYMDALKNVGMKHLAVSIPNVELVGFDTSKANALVQKLTTFTDAGVTCDVIVGNEPLASWYKGKYRNLVVPAFDLVKAAVAANTKVDFTKIKITVAFYYGIIGKSYPPSKGYFTSTDREIVRQVATREVETGSPFYMNIYPYFARQDIPKDISLGYALGNTGIYGVRVRVEGPD